MAKTAHSQSVVPVVRASCATDGLELMEERIGEDSGDMVIGPAKLSLTLNM
jgi:hypothetical protein